MSGIEDQIGVNRVTREGLFGLVDVAESLDIALPHDEAQNYVFAAGYKPVREPGDIVAMGVLTLSREHNYAAKLLLSVPHELNGSRQAFYDQIVQKAGRIASEQFRHLEIVESTPKKEA